MKTNSETRKLLNIYNRRLQILEEKKALYGHSVDPSILIEIEDLKAIVEKLEKDLNSLMEGGSHVPSRSNQEGLVDLRTKLIKHFNLEELLTLCFDLDIDSENFPQQKESFSRELIAYCSRHNKLQSLINYCKFQRPFLSWEI